jgi:hypothetical protein
VLWWPRERGGGALGGLSRSEERKEKERRGQLGTQLRAREGGVRPASAGLKASGTSGGGAQRATRNKESQGVR